jgi:hypothetical protein
MWYILMITMYDLLLAFWNFLYCNLFTVLSFNIVIKFPHKYTDWMIEHELALGHFFL